MTSTQPIGTSGWATSLSTTLWFVSLIMRGILHTGFPQEKWIEASLILQFHVPLYKWCPFTEWF
jgi:hypothetical protein